MMDTSRFGFMGTSKSHASLSSMPVHKREYPTDADAYELIEECGRGVSATVYRAREKNSGEEVAIKKLDLENLNCSLDEIVREAQTMRSLNHPTLLPLHCSFVHDQHLWMVMPYVKGGSVLSIMRYRFPDGLDEPAIATIMKEVLRALEYLHRNGVIHRDIKAGNILIDHEGHVLLADFGVAATLERGGSWGNRMMSRNTFVGTPCWMAPEVMQQENGYDSRADVWSFGITLLELAHGHAPFARLPPMKVLLMTLQNPPPTLEQADSKKTFSKAMRDIVAKCLVKDPKERPTASQLLEHKFFKTAHDAHYLVRHVLDGLPSVPERVEFMRQAHGAAAGHRNEAQEREILESQKEYRRGVSSWNFDVAAIKAAAAAAAAEEAARLPAITESLETADSGLLSHQISDASAMGGDGSMSPSKVMSPTHSSQALTGGRGGIKEHGRFKVYEGGDEPPPFSPPINGSGAALMEEAMGRAGTPPMGGGGLAGEADADGAKRKGRFRYIEEDFGPDGKPRMQKTASQVTVGDAGKSGGTLTSPPGGPSVSVLLGPLKELLENATLQHEALREMAAAVADVEKGKQGALNAFLQQRHQLRPESEKLRSEVAALKEENARLKERLRALEGTVSTEGSRRATGQSDEVP